MSRAMTSLPELVAPKWRFKSESPMERKSLEWMKVPAGMDMGVGPKKGGGTPSTVGAWNVGTFKF